MNEERPRRRRLRDFDLRKALFILPNAFTVSSIFCGLYAILLATHEEGGIPFAPGEPSLALYQAALAIFIAGLFDLFDGRVARLTKTQSEFGVQMDSLADLISFGVAPGVLVYKWALQPLDLVGMLVAFAFAVCGAIRLARFNVMAARGDDPGTHFVGLPIPVAASMIVSLVVAHRFILNTEVQRHGSVMALVVILGFLMVSNVTYPTFKKTKPSLRLVPIIGSILVLGALITFYIHITAALVVLIGSYVAYGMLNWFFGVLPLGRVAKET